MTTAPDRPAPPRRPPARAPAPVRARGLPRRPPATPGADPRRRRGRPGPPPRPAGALGAGRRSCSPRSSAASGIALYAGLWLVLPADTAFETGAPGLESATRGGRRPGRIRRLDRRRPGDRAGRARRSARSCCCEAVLGARRGVLADRRSACVGVALLWRQADEAQRERWLDTTGRIDPVADACSAAAAGRRTPGSSPASACIAHGVRALRAARRLAPHGPRRAGRGAARRRRARRSWSVRGSSGWPPTSPPSAPSGSAPRSAPTSPPTCTTRCCRPWP